jgi:hypothetical protein
MILVRAKLLHNKLLHLMHLLMLTNTCHHVVVTLRSVMPPLLRGIINLDFRFAQDFKFGSKHKQVITFTYDIVNLTNLLNKKWGQYYFSANTFNSTSSVGLTPVKRYRYAIIC